MKQWNKKLNLHPVMIFLILTGLTIILSGVLNLLDINEQVYHVNSSTLEYSVELVSVLNLFSLSGFKYIFSETVANFVNFTPFSTFIIVLIGFGVMEASGFLKSFITLITKKMKKNVVTFLIVFLSIIGSFMGDISFVIMMPLSALIFKYGRRNPVIGIVASFAGLCCGQGLSLWYTSVDSTLLSSSLAAARVIDAEYRMASISGLFLMFVSAIVLSIVIVNVTEKNIALKVGKIETTEEEEFKLGKKERRGLMFSALAALAYFLFFLYNIIPGLPFSGKLLDNSQLLYVDKLFNYNSFFSNGFVFIVTFFFVILGLFYGMGAKTITSNKEFVESLAYSLDDIGGSIILIFVASLFISVFKYSNIGTVLVAILASFIRSVNFQGIPLILLLFVVSIISTFILPGTVSKWAILSPIVVPVFMNAGITPEFSQIIFRLGEGVSFGLTPLMSYFVIYLAIMMKYNKDMDSPMYESIKYQVPYSIATLLCFAVIIVLWYVVGLPLGINGVPVL